MDHGRRCSGISKNSAPNTDSSALEPACGGDGSARRTAGHGHALSHADTGTLPNVGSVSHMDLVGQPAAACEQ